MWARCGRDVVRDVVRDVGVGRCEMWVRCGRDMGEMWAWGGARQQPTRGELPPCVLLILGVLPLRHIGAIGTLTMFSAMPAVMRQVGVVMPAAFRHVGVVPAVIRQVGGTRVSDA